MREKSFNKEILQKIIMTVVIEILVALGIGVFCVHYFKSDSGGIMFTHHFFKAVKAIVEVMDNHKHSEEKNCKRDVTVHNVPQYRYEIMLDMDRYTANDMLAYREMVKGNIVRISIEREQCSEKSD